MRLPWLQVNTDGITRGKMLGRLLGIGEHAGVGVVVQLWAWALEVAPDGDFRGFVSDPRALVAGSGLDPAGSAPVLKEMQVVGLIATHPKLRVRGLDRYVHAWRKNRKSRGAGAVPALTSADLVPEPALKTETETETETETDTSKDLLLRREREAPAAKKIRANSEQQNIFDLLETDRVDRCNELGIDPGEREQLNPGRINAMIGNALKTMSPAELVAVFCEHYLFDDKWRDKSPPWPIALFFSPGVIAKNLDAYRKSDGA